METVERIYEFARETPDAPAIVFNLEPISFRRLHRMVTAMRHQLEAADLPQGGLVVVRIRSNLLGWVVNLAARTLGLTTAAVHTQEELNGFAGMDVAALVIAAENPDPPTLDAPGHTLLRVRQADVDAPDDGAPLEPPPEGPRGNHILLTSATTGHYKMVEVDAMVQAKLIAIGMARYLETQEPTPQGFDGRLMHLLNLGIWTAAGYGYPMGIWTIGAGVVIHQGPDVHKSFELPGLTHILATPGLLAPVMAQLPEDFQRRDDIVLMIVGGALSVGMARQVQSRLTPNITMTLGSTESGNWASTEIKSDEDLRWHRLNAWRTVEVVDEDDKPLPPGQLGQVRVLLEGSFSGYLNAPEASANFLRDRYFYPGDLGVLDGQGRLALYGRVTEVLNFLGDKVPAAPLEAALQEALNIEGVCLMSEQGEGEAEDLHVILEAAEPPPEDVLAKAVKDHLSGFPVVRFHFIEQFPRNHMGKIERLKLRRQLVERRRAQES